MDILIFLSHEPFVIASQSESKYKKIGDFLSKMGDFVKIFWPLSKRKIAAETGQVIPFSPIGTIGTSSVIQWPIAGAVLANCF